MKTLRPGVSSGCTLPITFHTTKSNTSGLDGLIAHSYPFMSISHVGQSVDSEESRKNSHNLGIAKQLSNDQNKHPKTLADRTEIMKTDRKVHVYRFSSNSTWTVATGFPPQWRNRMSNYHPESDDEGRQYCRGYWPHYSSRRVGPSRTKDLQIDIVHWLVFAQQDSPLLAQTGFRKSLIFQLFSTITGLMSITVAPLLGLS